MNGSDRCRCRNRKTGLKWKAKEKSRSISHRARREELSWSEENINELCVWRKNDEYNNNLSQSWGTGSRKRSCEIDERDEPNQTVLEPRKVYGNLGPATRTHVFTVANRLHPRTHTITNRSGAARERDACDTSIASTSLDFIVVLLLFLPIVKSRQFVQSLSHIGIKIYYSCLKHMD